MSSAEPGSEEPRSEDEPPPAESITDPALAAEVDNPSEANVPTGEEAAPGGGTTAADEGPIAAPGAPRELSSEQTPPQGDERRADPAPAESLGDVPGGDAGSPESVNEPDVPEPGDNQDARSPGASGASAVAPDQPPPTPSAAVAEGAAVQRATEEKVAQAVAAREAAASAPGEPEPGEIDEARQGLVDDLARILGSGVVQTDVVPGVDAWVRVTIDEWRSAAEACRDQLGLTYFCYLSAIDWLPSPYGRSEEPPEDGDTGDGEGVDGADAQPAPATAPVIEPGLAGGETRFQLLARLVSPTSHLGLTLKADLPDGALVAPSLIEVFPGADWHEREVWEMYGVDFTGHPHLVHLYLPGGFEGHPLRKDFPLLAREVKPWPGLVDVEAMPGEGEGG